MSGFGIGVHCPSGMQGTLDQEVASNKPAVVNVVSDIDGMAPGMWTPS